MKGNKLPSIQLYSQTDDGAPKEKNEVYNRLENTLTFLEHRSEIFISNHLNAKVGCNRYSNIIKSFTEGALNNNRVFGTYKDTEQIRSINNRKVNDTECCKIGPVYPCRFQPQSTDISFEARKSSILTIQTAMKQLLSCNLNFILLYWSIFDNILFYFKTKV